MSIKTPELHPVSVMSPCFHVVMDFVGPINPTSHQGNKYILTLSDYFTMFVEAVALPNKCAPGVAKLFLTLLMISIYICDRGCENRPYVKPFCQ